jgi:hypothetical protein
MVVVGSRSDGVLWVRYGNRAEEIFYLLSCRDPEVLDGWAVDEAMKSGLLCVEATAGAKGGAYGTVSMYNDGVSVI